MSRSAQGSILAFIFVTSLFFAWGFVTSTIDPLVTTVRGVFKLSFAEAMLTQFAWFIAYGVMSLPAAALLSRLGYAASIIVALGAMVLGCLVIPVATNLDLYPGVLVALFIIASGVTLLQVAANPLAAGLGRPEGAHFRLTFSQAFNSLGTVAGPFLGASIMLRGGVFNGAETHQAAERAQSLHAIDTAFLIVGAFFAALAVFIFLVRKRIAAAAPPSQAASPWRAFQSGWALAGGLAIFLYVGAEVAVASIMINFLLQIHFVEFLEAKGFLATLQNLHLLQAGNQPPEIAGKLLGLFYWGGAMVGRFVGSWLLTKVRAGVLLAICATVTTLLCLYVTQAGGAAGGVAALAIGFFNSIMFPTIFTLTLDRSSAPASSTSGLLCMAIVGGAALPWLTGRTADLSGLNTAFFVPLLGYIGIVLFALAAARAKGRGTDDVAAPSPH